MLTTSFPEAHGKVIKPLCYGPGKVYWASKWLEEKKLSMAESYFYTDSFSDLDLLERVRYPVAVNPDRKLKSVALKRHWPVKEFKSVKNNLEIK